jgi:hypothetical protein
MTLKEMAKAFEMSVDDFAKCIGYTKQALYNKTSVRKTNRAKAAVSFLRFLNDSMFRDETEKVNQRFFARQRAVEAFRKMMLGDGDGNG